MNPAFDSNEQRRQWRIDALFWGWLICWDDPADARARAFFATRLLELGAIP
jgi:hypothetical protein